MRIKIEESCYRGVDITFDTCYVNADTALLVKEYGEEYIDNASIKGKTIEVNAKKMLIELIEDENDELHIIVKLYVI